MNISKIFQAMSFIFLITLKNSSKVTDPDWERSAARIISWRIWSETYSPIS